MKKLARYMAMLMILVISACPAFAIEMLDEDEYTDVPTVMTQDSVVSVEADQECMITLRLPEDWSMELLEDVYNFVWKEKNRPVRYYDEETQKKIQELVPGVDIDVLHMTEFMGQDMTGEPEETVHVERLLDVDYQPGQLIVVVLGYEEENGEYRWFPYRGNVPELGLIEYDIPVEDYELLVGKPVIYHVLTTRVGARGDILVNSEIITERVYLPSKDVEDIVRIRRWYTSTGETIDDYFRIFLVDKTQPMLDEIARIGEFLVDEEAENAAIDWFPEERIEEAQLLIEDVDVRELLIYDVVAVMSEEYKDTYGDVSTENIFKSAFNSEGKMVVMLGFFNEEAEEEPYFEWYCLRAEAMEEDYVEILFKQLVIPTMEEEPAMMVVLSEPIVEEEE